MASVTGRQVSVTDSLKRCGNDCELKIQEVVLNADELDIQPTTGDAEARGEYQNQGTSALS